MAWRDVRSRPMDTAALIALVALSVLLATASAGLLASVGGAANRLLARADSPHVAQMHAGELDERAIDEWAGARTDVAAHQVMPLLTLDGRDLKIDGAAQSGSVQQNSLMVPTPERDQLLTLDGAVLGTVAPGEVWLPVYYAIEEEISVGDEVVITANDGYRAEFVVAGFHRDPVMNTAIASSKRLAVNAADLADVARHTGATEYLIEFWLDDPAQAGAFTAAYLASGLPSDGPTADRSTFRLFSIMSEGLNAGVAFLAAALLLVVALLCLRLSILTALERDLREIGVLKAIGAPRRDVRRMQLARYGAIGLTACLLGLAGGLALLPTMSRSLTAYLGASSALATWLAPVLTAAGIFLLVLAFVTLVLRRIGRISAVEALHASAASARRGRSWLTLHRSAAPVGVRLGLIGALRRWRTSALLVTVFAVATFLVLVPIAAATTIASPSFTTYMGIPRADLLIGLTADEAGEQDGTNGQDRAGGPGAQGRSGAPAGRLAEVTQALQDHAAVDRFVTHTSVRAEITDADGLPVGVFVENGDNTTLPLTYTDGRAPRAEDELALSLVALAATGTRVGESIEVRSGDVDTEVEIVGSYQDVTNGGRTGRGMLPTAGADVAGYSVVVDLADAVAPAATAEQLRETVDGRVAVVEEYRDQTLGPVAEQVTRTAVVGGAVALVLAALMTIMTTRLVLAADAGQIAIQRAVSMSDGAVRSQYRTQVLAALAVGLPLGVFGAATFGQSVFNLLFEGLYGGFEMVGQGTSRIEFVFAPLLTFGVLPLALAVVVAGATAAACHDIRSMGIRTVVPE